MADSSFEAEPGTQDCARGGRGAGAASATRVRGAGGGAEGGVLGAGAASGGCDVRAREGAL